MNVIVNRIILYRGISIKWMEFLPIAAHRIVRIMISMKDTCRKLIIRFESEKRVDRG